MSGGSSRFSKGNVLGWVVGPCLGHLLVLHCSRSQNSRQPPSSEPCGTCGMAIRVSQRGPAAPKSTLTRLRCAQRVSAPALAMIHCRHTSRCPFLQPVRLSAQKTIPVSGQRCSPTAFAGRRLLPNLGQLSLHLCYLQVTSTVPAEAHLPLLYRLLP